MIPLDPFMTLGSFALKGAMSLWSRKQKNHRELEEIKLTRHAAEVKDVQHARSNDTKEFSFARRYGFVFATTVLYGLPIIAPLIGAQVAIGYTVWDPGWLWVDGKEVVEWRMFGDPDTAAVVIPATLYNLYSVMVGLYFGKDIK